MIINKYDYLPKEAFQIRERVFQTEQGFEDEFDAIDDISVHLVLLDGDKAIATCRYYWCEEKNTHVVGRIAVVREYRGKELGARILKEDPSHSASEGDKWIN